MHAFVRSVLEKDGHQILAASDGEAAQEKAGAGRPDLIILDVQMPKKDAFRVFEDLRKSEARNTPTASGMGVRLIGVQTVNR